MIPSTVYNVDIDLNKEDISELMKLNFLHEHREYRQFPFKRVHETDTANCQFHNNQRDSQ